MTTPATAQNSIALSGTLRELLKETMLREFGLHFQEQVADIVAEVATTPEGAALIGGSAEQLLKALLKPEPTPKPHYPNFVEFVDDFIRVLYLVDAGQRDDLCWCEHWWMHGFAVARLRELHRAWEYLRLDKGVGPNTWWLQHFDPTMAKLMHPAGPFKRCSANGKHAVGADAYQKLPGAKPPEALLTADELESVNNLYTDPAPDSATSGSADDSVFGPAPDDLPFPHP